jgi:arylformamidase
MKKMMVGLAAVAFVGSAAIGQRERLPQQCRVEIQRLCPIGGALRQCLRTVLPKLSDGCRKAASERAAGRAERPAGMREVAYGADPKQRLDLLAPQGTNSAPILFFVHGGGWSIGDKATGGATKGPWANGLGWAYVSANYRLVPQASVEQQAADLASALAWLRMNAAKEGLDPDRIVLMGHSAGAHLVALLGTDPRYLKAAGVPLAAVSGVVLLDGAGYDIPAQGSAETNLVKPMYAAAFGSDPKRQAALSPTRHAAAPNASRWLILPIQSRADSQAQSKGLSAALEQAGASANVVVVPGESHRTLNQGLGEKGDLATGEVERFLTSVR